MIIWSVPREAEICILSDKDMAAKENGYEEITDR